MSVRTQKKEAILDTMDKWCELEESGKFIDPSGNCPLCRLCYEKGCSYCPASKIGEYSNWNKSYCHDWMKEYCKDEDTSLTILALCFLYNMA
jgi:hypothetical protein